jgi:hypothetical protein
MNLDINGGLYAYVFTYAHLIQKILCLSNMDLLNPLFTRDLTSALDEALLYCSHFLVITSYMNDFISLRLQ